MEKEKRNEFTDQAVVIPEWLTADLFEDLMKKKFSAYKLIKKFSVKPGVKEGENFLTVLQRVHLDVEMGDGTQATVSYMVKTLPRQEYLRNLVQCWQIFDKECTTYKTYLPAFEDMYRNVGLNVNFGPKIYQLSLPDKYASEILAMEDLKTKGFGNIKRQEGMDMTHIEATFQKVAQFHAASVVYYDINGPYPSMYDKCFCSETDDSYKTRANLNELLRECLILYGDASHLDEKLQRYCESAYDPNQTAIPQQSGEFYVLNHGDLWSNNIMFQYDDSGAIKETCLLDFQLNLFGSPAADLYRLLLSSTNLEIKLRHFDYFIAFYHSELVKYLKLLDYAKEWPTLRDIHIALYRHGNWAYTVVSDLLSVILFENVSMDAWLNDQRSVMRKKMYRSQRYIDHMTQLLPWLDARGLLDFVPENRLSK